MFIQVIPYITSFDADPVTYLVPKQFEKDISIGALVEVPWGNKIIPAIVFELDSKKPQDIEPKALVKPLTSVKVFTDKELSMIHSLARKYFFSIHTIAQTFFPKNIFTRSEKKDFLNLSDAPAIQDGSSSWDFTIEKESVLFEKLNEHIQKTGGVLVVPDTQYVDALGQKEECFSSHLKTPKEKYDTYLETLSAEKRVICGPRSLLTYRLGNYENIYYIHDGLYSDLHIARRPLPCWEILKTLRNSGHNIHIFSSVPGTQHLFDFFENQRTV